MEAVYAADEFLGNVQVTGRAAGSSILPCLLFSFLAIRKMGDGNAEGSVPALSG